MKVTVKKLSDKAVMPTLNPIAATKGRYDLYASKISTEVGEDAKLVIVYHTDLTFDIPEGYYGVVYPREDIFKKSLGMVNSFTIVEPNKEVIVKFKTNTDVVPSVYKDGTSFAQMILIPSYEFELIEEVTPETTVEEAMEQEVYTDNIAE